MMFAKIAAPFMKENIFKGAILCQKLVLQFM